MSVRQKYLFLIISVVVLLSAGIFTFVAFGQRDIYRDISKPVTIQLAIADSLADKGNIEEALARYHVITDKWKEIDPSDITSARATLTAALVEAQICFNIHSDYGRELLALNRAAKIAKKFNLPDVGVNFLLASLYCTIAQQNNVPEYFDKAASYYISVLDNKDKDDSKLHHYAVSNLILFADKGKVAHLSRKSLDRYFSSTYDAGERDEQIFNRRISELMKCVRNKDHKRAQIIADTLRTNPSIPSERVLPGIYFIAGQSAANSGDYNQAVKYFKLSEKLINLDNGKDMLLEVYEATADAYFKLGDEIQMGRYAMKAGELRRDLTSFAKISALKGAEIDEQITAIQDTLNQERSQSSRLRIWIIVFIIVVVIAGAFIGMLSYFLRRMRTTNRLLYDRYVELLKVNDYEEVDNSVVSVADNHRIDTEKASVDSVTGSDHEQELHNVSNGDIEEVQRIETVFNHSDEIFQSDFNMAMLARLTGLRSRRLSVLIQEYYNMSFRNFVNSRRIRAVCLRLETSDMYANLTVDAIAESVGIKSRTTFTDSFKKETGMTPAQYIKFAAERKKNLNQTV